MTENVSTPPPPQTYRTTEEGSPVDVVGESKKPAVAQTIREAVMQSVIKGTHAHEIEEARREIIQYLCTKARTDGVTNGTGDDAVLLKAEQVLKLGPNIAASPAWIALRDLLRQQGVYAIPRGYPRTVKPATRRCLFCGHRPAVVVMETKFWVFTDPLVKTAFTEQLAGLVSQAHNSKVHEFVLAARLAMTTKEQATHSIVMSAFPAFSAWSQLDAALLSEGVTLVRVREGTRYYECL